MQVPFLDLKRSHQPIQDELEATFKRVLDDSYFVYDKDVTAFERAFSVAHESDTCISTGNCTDALQLTLQAMGIGAGDEVMVPAMTWITDAEVVSNLGAQPVFIDINEFGLIDVNQLQSNLSAKTRAIIPVHLYGQMADMSSIMHFAKANNLLVIEDCAQSVFAEQLDKRAGTYGHAAVFSFYPTKNLGALGDAGCVITKDTGLALKIRKLANHGAADKHSHEMPGSNSRMDTLQAAILNLKLPLLKKWNQERRKAASFYQNGLDGLPLILPRSVKGNIHIFHVYQVQTEQRDALKAFLKTAGVQTQIHYPQALPFTKAYASLEHKTSDFPAAYRLQNQTLSLPLFPGLTEDEQAYVVKSIHSFFKKESAQN